MATQQDDGVSLFTFNQRNQPLSVSLLSTAPTFFYAERGIAICHTLMLSVCPSVCLSVCNVEIPRSYRFGYFESYKANNWPRVFAVWSPKIGNLMQGIGIIPQISKPIAVIHSTYARVVL